MRGCERKIIMLKGTDSEIFDEAYFLLRRDFKDNGDGEEIVREAQRIVASNTIKKRRRLTSVKERIFFAVGTAVGAAVAVLICLAWIV